MGHVELNDVLDDNNATEDDIKRKIKVGDSVMAKIKYIDY